MQRTWINDIHYFGQEKHYFFTMKERPIFTLTFESKRTSMDSMGTDVHFKGSQGKKVISASYCLFCSNIMKSEREITQSNDISG